ncbi:MAG TPA: ImmA/IrrE family metallo-endopeptidase [Candidatus Uhrbacteria bacterium]|nr:ImmA/IrrE family metallo-endopeptidase [Candidatus Uhrbacteria bacterium]
MPNILGRQHNVESEYWLRQYKRNGIPLDCERAYFYCLNKLIVYYKELIGEIIKDNDGVIEFPMQTSLIENYLSGYQIQYFGFYGKAKDLSGYWESDEEDNSIVRIFYNTNATFERQRFTIIHELFHFCQSLDIKIQDYFDGLIVNSTLPKDVVVNLIEKATDKATAMYLMPNKYFEKKYYEVKDVQTLSDYFQVSAPSIIYRIKECGLPILQ